MKNFFLKNIKTWILLILVVLLGAYLRFHDLGKYSFDTNEFSNVNASYGYSNTGNWQNWDFNLNSQTKVNSDKIERIYSWQVAQLFKILPPTEAVARSVSVFWGIFTILLIYFLAYYFTKNKTIGLISSFLFSISPTGIMFNTRVESFSMFLPVFLLFSVMVFCFFEEKYEGRIGFVRKINGILDVNIIFVFPVLLLGAASYYLNHLTASIFLTFIVYAIARSTMIFEKDRSIINKYTISLGGIFILGAVIRLLFPNKFEVLSTGMNFSGHNFSYFSKIAFDYSYWMIAAGFIFFGVYYIYKKTSMKKEAIWICSSLVTIFLAESSLWKSDIGSNVIFFVRFFEIVLIAGGAYYLAEFFSENFSKKYKKTTFLISLAMTLLILPNFSNLLSVKSGDNKENENYKTAFKYFINNKKEGELLITRGFRNYYFSNANVNVLDFGTEMKSENKKYITKKNIVSKMSPGGCAWMIWSSDDENFIKKDAKDFITEKLDIIDDKNFDKSITVRHICIKNNKDTLKFGFITDAHSYNKSLKNKEKMLLGYEVNKKASDYFKVFIDQMNNSFLPDFVVQGGDLVEGSYGSSEDFIEAKKLFDKINAPKFNVLGNHDLRTLNKDEWLGLVGYGSTYYYFDENNYRMIVLDGNFMPPQMGEADIDKNTTYYNGYVSEKQIKWLIDVLKKSVDKKVIVFIHQPSVPSSKFKDSQTLLINGGNLRSIFEKYKVMAVFSGHIEELCRQEINGVKYFILPGLYRGNNQEVEEGYNKYKDFFSEIVLNGQNINVEVFYRNTDDKNKKEYKSIILKNDNIGCNVSI